MQTETEELTQEYGRIDSGNFPLYNLFWIPFYLNIGPVDSDELVPVRPLVVVKKSLPSHAALFSQYYFVIFINFEILIH
jgi:hypothetical protein